MSVYVDDAFKNPGYGKFYKGGHMAADTHDELECMARRIGLRPGWIQKAGTTSEHYDLMQNRRNAAIAAGAVRVTARQMVGILQRKRRATEALQT